MQNKPLMNGDPTAYRVRDDLNEWLSECYDLKVGPSVIFQPKSKCPFKLFPNGCFATPINITSQKKFESQTFGWAYFDGINTYFEINTEIKPASYDAKIYSDEVCSEIKTILPLITNYQMLKQDGLDFLLENSSTALETVQSVLQKLYGEETNLTQDLLPDSFTNLAVLYSKLSASESNN